MERNYATCQAIANRLTIKRHNREDLAHELWIHRDRVPLHVFIDWLRKHDRRYADIHLRNKSQQAQNWMGNAFDWQAQPQTPEELLDEQQDMQRAIAALNQAIEDATPSEREALRLYMLGQPHKHTHMTHLRNRARAYFIHSA